MQGFTVLVFLGLLACAFGGPTPRIVGGSKAPDGKYPYQVALRYFGSFLCGGSILNDRYILTAAHCVKGRKASLMSVTVGTNSITLGQGTKYSVEKLTAHEKYDGSLIVNDIGLIRLTKKIQFNEKVQPIVLPNEDFKALDTFVKLTGWGSRSAIGLPPKDLQEIDLKVIKQDQCRKMWSVRDSHICTLTKAGEGACFGDSGGPLVAADGAQIGIVSYGEPCGKGKPDVYTRVYSFLEWIKENTY